MNVKPEGQDILERWGSSPVVPVLPRRAAVVLLFFAGLTVSMALSPRSSLLANLAITGAVMVALLVYYYPSSFADFCRGLLTVTVVSAFIGAAFFPVEVGFFALFPFRIFLILLWLGFLVGLLVSGRINLAELKVKDYLLFFAAWFLYAVVSLGWAASKEYALVEIVFLGSGFSLVFFIVYFYRTRTCLNLLFGCLVGATVFILAIALWENLTGNHLPISAANYYPPHRIFMPTGVFHNPNDLAFYLTLSFPFLISLARYRRGTARWAGLLLGAISLYVVAATQSRASYFSLFILLLVFFILFLRPVDKIKALALAVLLAAVLVFLFPAAVRSAAATVVHQVDLFWTGFSLDRRSVFIRLNLILNGLIFLYRSCFFGVGAGNVEYHMQYHAPYNTGRILNMHNWWVEILANYGIIIFAAYVVVMATLIFNLYIYWQRSRESDRFILEPLVLSLIGFVVASTSPSRIIGLNVVWIQMGFALAALGYCRQRTEGGTGP